MSSAVLAANGCRLAHPSLSLSVYAFLSPPPCPLDLPPPQPYCPLPQSPKSPTTRSDVVAVRRERGSMLARRKISLGATPHHCRSSPLSTATPTRSFTHTPCPHHHSFALERKTHPASAPIRVPGVPRSRRSIVVDARLDFATTTTSSNPTTHHSATHTHRTTLLGPFKVLVGLLGAPRSRLLCSLADRRAPPPNRSRISPSRSRPQPSSSRSQRRRRTLR